MNHIHKLADVLPHLFIEIEHFFDVYKELEKKKTAVEGWEDAEVARRVIQDARERFKSSSLSG